ncbi:unnamed protein product [Clonostachys solani]|uniref:Up-regulated in Daf-2 domain-containing protein n=1 Tax=Clonostachys solani TaxID=160281 RepID=A0A9N9W6U0_9HYPO|nr:unnamed protein product [Clonostachys solani]
MHVKYLSTLLLAVSQSATALVTGTRAISNVASVAPALEARWPWSVNKRTAQVVVENQTGKTIYGVGLVHKYSDNYVNSEDWAELAHGETSDPSLTVNYHTGDWTTGRDWWLVTWLGDDGKSVLYTDPNNGRCWIDQLEQAATKIIPKIAAAIAKAQLKVPGANKLVKAITKELLKPLMNKAETCGFKQHILRDDDSNSRMTITLKKGGEVVLKSPTGISYTSWKSKPLA